MGFHLVNKMKEGVDLVEILFIVLGVALNYKVWQKGFFAIPSRPQPLENKDLPCLRHVACAFVLFFLGSLVGTKVFIFTARHLLPLDPGTTTLQDLTSLVQPVALLSAGSFLYLYFRKSRRPVALTVCKDVFAPEASTPLKDWLFGMLSWLLGFPVSAAAGMLAEAFVHLVHSAAPVEQVAVRYLKASSETPLSLCAALITIVIAAPIIEEFLFRGLLQSYLKKKLGVKAAILMSSLFFALFHASASQGIDNISIITSLFFFALYLGFVYEKRGSLFASAGLHMTFNTINTIRILFFSE
jgi:membrane protease YdiL (CAAX protease family)